MFKRILAIAAMVFVLPALANAQEGKLELWAKSAGGKITITNSSPVVVQTSAYGQSFKSYSTAGADNPTVTVAPNPGFKVVAGATTNCGGSSIATGPGSTTLTCTNGQYVHAAFEYAPTKIDLTAKAEAGGKVNIAKIDNIFYGQKLLNPIKFKFTPATGYKITAVKLNGTQVASDGLIAVATVLGGSQTVTFQTDYQFLDNQALVATFEEDGSVTPTARTGAPQTITGTTATLTSASLGNDTSWKWEQTAGPVDPVTKLPVKAVITVPTAETTEVTGLSVNGTYYFKLTINGGSTATTTIIKTGSIQTAAQSQCASCHASNGVGIGIYDAWSTSVHKDNVICASCHVGANTAAHPGVAKTCTGCHAAGKVAPLPASHLIATDCLECHATAGDAHDIKKATHDTTIAGGSDATSCGTCHSNAPHYGGQAFHKAQYVSNASLPVSCDDCHGSAVNTTANQAILRQFTSSSHGRTTAEAWVHFDWRGANRSVCQRCHAGTAFVAKLGNENSKTNAYQATDVLKPGEVLNCSACHSDVSTGAIRSADQSFTINMTNGATVTYDVAGASTLCARCHSGRETGASITADPNTTGVAVFVDSHYQPAAGTLYNQAGYEFESPSWGTLGSHKLLGATSQGPCVTCHMSGKNHTFAAASCGTCHNGVTAPLVNAADKKASYDAALNDLKLALAAKGIHYGPVHPFFFTAPYVAGGTNVPVTNWAAAYGAGSWKHTMGAAFNYNLLWSEKGAYAHNYDYAMKLIADSIDFLTP